MSKGSPIVPVRFADAELLAEMDSVIARTADIRKDGPWTRTSFILAAVRDKLDHMRRSRRHRKRRKSLTVAGDNAECISTSSAPNASQARP